MIYTNPNNVISPQDCVKHVNVIYDGGIDDVSIAELLWIDETCLAMRWNASVREMADPEKVNGNTRCVGMPTSHGIPVWFILPDDMFDDNSKLRKALDAAGKAMYKKT